MTTKQTYYGNVNQDLLKVCPASEFVMEFGCGEGNFLAAYKNTYPSSNCSGFELFEAAANKARTKLDQVYQGNAEEVDLSDLEISENYFDLLIYGDVIEHFSYPWKALEKHIKYLKPGGYICACIPNVSHWSMIYNLINGEFEYRDSGLMDRTHLRFFTRSSIIKMFQNLGMEIELIQPRVFNTKKTENALKTIARIFDKPIESISASRVTDWSAFQYVIKAKKIVK